MQPNLSPICWTRQVGRAPGSESSVKMAVSAVKTLDGGTGDSTARGWVSMEWGDIVIEGCSPDHTLFMRRDQLVAESGG